MATIQLNNNDLRVMIREAVERLCEGQWYEAEPLCRLPYFVSVNFSDHAIAREDERDISEDTVIENLRQVIKQVIKDYSRKAFGPDDYIKVIDRDTCIVAVCGMHPTYNNKRIKQIVVVTCYVWDGRINIDKGNNYYINDESPAYLEAKQWNEENQDKVMSYIEWKRYGDSRAIKQQRNKADKEYYWRNHPHEPSREKVMDRLDRAYQRKEKADRQDIHDSLPDGDLDAIRDYFKYFDRRQLSSMDSANKELWADDYRKKMEASALQEFAHRAAKQAILEAYSSLTIKNPSTTKKAGKSGFCI